MVYIAGKNMEVKPSPTDAGWFNVYSPAGLLLSEWRTENRATSFVEAAIERDRQRDDGIKTESTRRPKLSHESSWDYWGCSGPGSDNGDNSPG